MDSMERICTAGRRNHRPPSLYFTANTDVRYLKLDTRWLKTMLLDLFLFYSLNESKALSIMSVKRALVANLYEKIEKVYSKHVNVLKAISILLVSLKTPSMLIMGKSLLSP